MKRRSKTFWLMVGLIVVLLAAPGAYAADYTMKIGSATSTRFAASGVMPLIKEALEQATYGRIKVEIFPSGQLGGEKALIEKTQTGVIQVAPASAPVAIIATATAMPVARYVFITDFLLQNCQQSHYAVFNRRIQCTMFSH